MGSKHTDSLSLQACIHKKVQETKVCVFNGFPFLSKEKQFFGAEF